MQIKFLLLFLLLSSATFAQLDEQNAFKASVGLSGHAIEKVNTPTLFLAYQKDFFPKTLIELNAAWATPVDVSTEEFMQDLQSFRFGMNFLFKVLEQRKQTFNVGMGFSGGMYNTDGIVIATQQDNSGTEFLPGFTLVTEYNYILPSQWFFGTRASIFRYDSNRRGWFLGVSLGYRF